MCQSPVGRSQCVRCFAVFHDFPDRAFCRDAFWRHQLRRAGMFLAAPTSGPRCPLLPLFLIRLHRTSRLRSARYLRIAASLNGSIAVALSVIPLASPASGVITRIDPTTGAELPSSISLGPIFTERAETIGRHKFYVGVSNQDFHFATLNGKTISPATMLQTQSSPTNVYLNGSPLPRSPPRSMSRWMFGSPRM